jgi:hypothetical protein
MPDVGAVTKEFGWQLTFWNALPYAVIAILGIVVVVLLFRGKKAAASTGVAQGAATPTPTAIKYAQWVVPLLVAFTAGVVWWVMSGATLEGIGNQLSVVGKNIPTEAYGVVDAITETIGMVAANTNALQVLMLVLGGVALVVADKKKGATFDIWEMLVNFILLGAVYVLPYVLIYLRDQTWTTSGEHIAYFVAGLVINRFFPFIGLFATAALFIWINILT